jgi:hypothetical protein
LSFWTCFANTSKGIFVCLVQYNTKEKRGTTLICERPEDLWLDIVPFVNVVDVASLLTTCTTLTKTLKSKECAICRLLAERKYPEETLHVDQYDNSWRDLLEDDNAKGGVYVLTTRTASYLKNKRVVGRLYVTSIEHLIWDKQERTVSLVIEAFGHDDS